MTLSSRNVTKSLLGLGLALALSLPVQAQPAGTEEGNTGSQSDRASEPAENARDAEAPRNAGEAADGEAADRTSPTGATTDSTREAGGRSPGRETTEVRDATTVRDTAPVRDTGTSPVSRPSNDVSTGRARGTGADNDAGRTGGWGWLGLLGLIGLAGLAGRGRHDHAYTDSRMAPAR